MDAQPDRYPDKENVSSVHGEAQDRGRHVVKPTDLPKKGWLDVFWRTKQQLNEDNLSIVAAGVAFYAFVAVVPCLAVAIAVYALVADPNDLTAQLQTLAKVVPSEVMPMLEEQIKRIASDNTKAGISAIVGVLIALYSSANAVKAIISGLNIAYDENEKRSFIKLSLLAIGMTFGMIIGAIFAVGLLAVLPSMLESVGLSGGAEMALNILRWPLLVGLFIFGVSVVYRFGPCRERAQWKWVSPGAVLAASLWVLGSALFSIYVSKFGSYDKTYGSLGAVVVFLMWLYLSAYVILLGAELNSEMERQTERDTTTGPEKPLGQRAAYAADTVGPTKEEVKASEASGETKKK